MPICLYCCAVASKEFDQKYYDHIQSCKNAFDLGVEITKNKYSKENEELKKRIQFLENINQ